MWVHKLSTTYKLTARLNDTIILIILLYYSYYTMLLYLYYYCYSDVNGNNITNDDNSTFPVQRLGVHR
jgi:hypothetical protein